MADPTDLIAHYSTKAFNTRIAALAFAGAALGADLSIVSNPGPGGAAVRGLSPDQASVLGWALLLIVASLAEANRRYTRSYLCACRATKERAWIAFQVMNEQPWTYRPNGGPAKRVALVNRFLLSWATFVPGFLAGVYLTLRGDAPWNIVAPTCALGLLAWWIHVAASLPDNLESSGLEEQVDEIVVSRQRLLREGARGSGSGVREPRNQ